MKSYCLLLSLPQFRYAQQLLPSCGIPILFMRLGAPHKIDRCANRCSLYPPQAAVAYVARQREPCFIKTENICDRRDSPCGCPTQAPSDEGAVILSKMTEGEKAINGKFSLFLLPSRLRRATYCPLAVSRFCLCGLERRTKSTAAPTDALFIRHRRRSHMLPVRGRLYSASIFI